MVVETRKLVRTEPAVLDIGERIGALIIYTQATLLGRQIDVSEKDGRTARIHTDVLERRFYGQTVYAALFQSLPEGEYYIWGNYGEPIGEIEITGGEVRELDWRHLFLDILDSTRLPTTLTNFSACPAPMGSAPMRYNDDGQVAWDKMWTDFCDLALLGGPPHRGTLLEPITPDQVASNPTRYEWVVSEIERGWQLVTRLPTTRCRTPGWVGLVCEHEAMALWLLRAILVENVSARREEATLFLPAGPDFTVEAEIKNVITVVAKTYHYWQEHLANS